MSKDLRTQDAWHEIHQPFELDWWAKHLALGHSSDPSFYYDWLPVREFIKPEGAVLDIGCGPRPPFAPCTVIEPLALEYQKLDVVPKHWWDGVAVYAQPAEELIPGLLADTIICWNCLDHTHGWRQILDNMLAYGNAGARFAIATDFFKPFVGHPGYERDDFMREIESRFHIIDKRAPFGRQLALLMTAR